MGSRRKQEELHAPCEGGGRVLDLLVVRRYGWEMVAALQASGRRWSPLSEGGRGRAEMFPTAQAPPPNTPPLLCGSPDGDAAARERWLWLQGGWVGDPRIHPSPETVAALYP